MDAPEWVAAMRDGAMRIMTVEHKEPLPVAFVKTGDSVRVVALTLDKELWLPTLQVLTKVAEADEVAFVGAQWKSTRLDIPPALDPLRESAAVFEYKQRGSATVAWQSLYEQADGYVTNAGPWTFVGEVASRLLDALL